MVLDSPEAPRFKLSAGPIPSHWNEFLHKPTECCNHWISGHAKVAPLLLTGVHLTPVSAGYGTHLEARWEVLTPGRTQDFCLLSKAVEKKSLRPLPLSWILHPNALGPLQQVWVHTSHFEDRSPKQVLWHLLQTTRVVIGNLFRLTFFMKNGDCTIICSYFQTGIKVIYLLKRKINIVFSFFCPLPFPTWQSRLKRACFNW